MIKQVLVLSANLLIASCVSPTPLVYESLDTSTGVTVTRNETPFLFYRDKSGVAAHARNFIQIGPVEINRSGSLEYFLWLGLWSTMQTTDLAEQRSGFESITLVVDGEPLALELVGWSPRSIGASEPIYLQPVASGSSGYFRVTLNQIRLIAEGVDVRLRTSGSSPSEYQLWNKQGSARESYRAFLAAASY